MLPDNIVLENGRLNEQLIAGKDILYKGNNGRLVERIYLFDGKSYIFKPLTNNAQLGKEIWVYEQLLPYFPAVFPKMISYRISENPDLSWMILEDLGPLSHAFSKDSTLAVVRLAAEWHSLPLERFVGVPLIGMKPRIEEMAAEVLANKDELVRYPFLQPVLAVLDQFQFSHVQVISHGDLHQGNFALTARGLVVLDWEHAHINLPYWDLYHALDLAHPDFPREITPSLREEALDAYLAQAERAEDRGLFKKKYYQFAAVFSMWMLLLIERDLKADEVKWTKVKLKRQQVEVLQGLEQLCDGILKS
ncbi:aminoglycoside phosphotransferase family protein [Neobacillus mesonae]|uniref:aminoglycoside phosphotransferase family protein n=1 Tax=Neobacillus mesonae TaxID=1193713 RepID=UPI00203B430C|nr:aminoglycoside phosphotransferase family protein [Neobacillus mesonae]MCM3567095.1 aminoglycoside phosphotransferase family protein [Neobacillus mesonae]